MRSSAEPGGRERPGAVLWELVTGRADAMALRWLDQARASAHAPLDRGAFMDAFTIATRRLGKAPLELDGGESARLASAGITWPLTGWALDEAGRVALLLRAAENMSPEGFETLVDECYRQGDNRERQAILKALPLLPQPERFVPLAVDACRTSIQPLFEAVACENPLPSTLFPDLNFNQMILKALFIGVPLDRVIGLEKRLTPDLARMAADYASERRAAGRSVPSDIARLLT